MQEKFTWVLENFSSLPDEECYSRPFTVAGCSWRLLAYPRGVRNNGYDYFSVYLDLAPGLYPPGWRREVNYRITLVNVWPQSNKVLGEQCCFDAKRTSFGFEEFLPLYKLHNKWQGFLVNDRLTIVAEVNVLPVLAVPVEPMKIIASLSSGEGNQASVSKSQGDSPCQVVQKTDNNASQENLDDDDDDDDDDYYVETSEESTDDDDDDASEESTDVDDASQEDPDDNDASSPGYDDGGSDISPLNQSNALEDASHTEKNHGISCNSVAAETEVSNGQNGARKEDGYDESSSLVLNDSARNKSTIDQVKSLEDASQAVEDGTGRGCNNVASVTESSNNVFKEIQPVKETMDISGFEVVSSKVESVKRHPESVKNQNLDISCYNFLLSLIERNTKNNREKTDNDVSQENLDDDDASEEVTDDDDDDDASEESLDDDDDASQEDPNDDDASSPVDDNGGSDISPLNQSNGLEDALQTVEYHGLRCNSVAAETETEVSNGENVDAPKEDVDDEVSSLVLNDSARNRRSLDKVKSLEDASQETMDINGFEVVSSKVESVRRIFEKHPDIVVEFRAKNQHLRNACMNFLLSLMETMCQSLEELSNEDLVEADIALTYLRDAGFKVGWLEKKLDQLKEKKEEEQSGLARLHEIEENLMILKQKWSDLDALAEKEKAELSVTRTALSFDDFVC